jgi:molybdopterin/thiamine biosynthesis adenylyltransferase
MVQELFDRERLAGYDTEVLKNARVTHVGCGAGDNNAAQCLSLAGVGEQRFIDFDHVEPSNLTRSPLFARLRHRGGSRSNKAKELALASLDLSYAEDPVVRYAPTRVEALGLGAFRGTHVVIAGVDNAGVRAHLATVTRLLGIPMVEAGFSGLRGNVSAYANASPEEPCYGCLNPNATPERVSCQTYAASVASEGRVPATQTMAAVTGALVAETVIRLLHRDTELSGRVLTLDAQSWRTSLMKLSRDPQCSRAHRKIENVLAVAVSANDAVAEVFRALPDFKEPELILPHAYVAAMPCAGCGTSLRVRKPEWAISGPPHCAACAAGDLMPATIDLCASVTPDSPLARVSCRKLGLPPLSIVEVFDRASGASVWIELAGSLDDLFVTRRRRKLDDAQLSDTSQHSSSSSEHTFTVLDSLVE